MPVNIIPQPVVGPSYNVITGIGSYHGVRRPIDEADTRNPFRVGFELEKEDSEVRTKLEGNTLAPPRGWIVENDSSLGEGGFEAVTRAYNLQYMEQLMLDIDLGAEIVNAEYSTQRCGGHVHVSDSRYSTPELLERIKPFLPLFMAMWPKRMSSTYVRCAKFSYTKKADGNKYTPFFITSRGTLEFRIPGAVRTVENMKWRARFIALMLEASRNRPVTFNYMLKELSPGAPLRALLNEVYTEEQVKHRITLYWAFAQFFFTDKPASAIIGDMVPSPYSIQS